MNLEPVRRSGHDINHIDTITLCLLNNGLIFVNSQIITYEKTGNTRPSGGPPIDEGVHNNFEQFNCYVASVTGMKKSLYGVSRRPFSAFGRIGFSGIIKSRQVFSLMMKTRKGVLPDGIENGMMEPRALLREATTLAFPPPEFLRSVTTLGRKAASLMILSSKTTILFREMFFSAIVLSKVRMNS